MVVAVAMAISVAVTVLAVFPVITDMFDRHDVLVLGGVEHDHALG